MGRVKVAGLWENPWFEQADERAWIYAMRDFGVEQVYMAPATGHASEFVTEVADVPTAIEANPDLTVVWVDEDAEETLREFEHPEDALYVTGKTSWAPMHQHRRDGDRAVRIETKPDGSNQGLLWAHQAMCVVLYDRLVKSWP